MIDRFVKNADKKEKVEERKSDDRSPPSIIIIKRI